ncbi:MAG: CoA pyrophosphatase [Desulfobacca sp.]|nr:CoA pyrophosphatase [Desulfobacca sp.]
MQKEKLRRLLNKKIKQIPDRPDLTPAAVLVPLFQKNRRTHILLTKRTDQLEHHKGQISFPGGAYNYEDLDCLTTALRETEEEIGIDMDRVEILGELDHIITVTHFRVCPYVGIIPYPYPFKLSSFEVERLIELPLDYLLKHAELKEGPFEFLGQSFFNLYIEYQGDIIWGATARILNNFVTVLSDVSTKPPCPAEGRGTTIRSASPTFKRDFQGKSRHEN